MEARQSPAITIDIITIAEPKAQKILLKPKKRSKLFNTLIALLR